MKMPFKTMSVIDARRVKSLMNERQGKLIVLR